jgi:hypothetical protein
MVMASHALAGGRLQLRSMLSLDPLTVGGRGYPLLLQTGETYAGASLRDRQHPHDFWMELGVLYERALTTDVAGFVCMPRQPRSVARCGARCFLERAR